MASKKNIVICGYQKSGTIWATRLMAELLQCPAVGYWGYHEPYSVTEGLNRESEYACYQSHHTQEELKALEPEKIHKLIYLVRDPRDIWVSGAHHFHFEKPGFTKSIQVLPDSFVKTSMKKLHQKILSASYRKQRMFNMLLKGDGQIPHAHWSWKQHVESHQKKQGVRIIRYEDLLQNSLTTCKSMLSYCEIPHPTDDFISECLDKQSFERRKKEFQEDDEKVKYRHLRKGVAGDWKNHLSDSDNEAICSELGNMMQAIGYASQ